MDILDYKILSLLKTNAREKASAISREIHLSVSSVIERIHKLETSGIIQSYTIITDEAAIGNDLTALMEISLEHPRFTENFVQYIKSNPNIVSCYYLTGEFDYMLKICCHSSKELEEIHREIKQQEGIRMTRTHYVLRTEKNIYTSLPEYYSEK
ncbi:MAG: Lrp/AsnC family transcriptional regulator [Lachnospiraceae bacterium]|nr:Lrp/AsnC family transcriptional regulator [Lachnospiraceae bacterium]MDD7077598.1 Lrp/AsnC family transcriptional regulator [Lachnospiraceae bacterium]MDY3729734.1 Lrp/AsnC family transcriptional regulator [Candidatus Choladocola sp.]